MAARPDHYRTLGVDKKASAEEIKKAYRRLARDYHPDRNPGDEKAEARFKEIQGAYDVIGDPDKRKDYDSGKLPFGGAGGGFGGARFVRRRRGRVRRRALRSVRRRDARPRGPRRARAGALAWARHRGRGLAVVPAGDRRRPGDDHRPDDRPLSHLPRDRCQSGHGAARVPGLQRPRRRERGPGPVLDLPAVLALPGLGHGDRQPLRDLLGARARGASCASAS